jgi:uncharacterized protein (DUF342 family)
MKADDRRSALEIIVSEDNLQAYMIPNDDELRKLDITNIKYMIREKGIKYGFFDDGTIAANLKAPDGQNNRIDVAAGKPPIAGKDAEFRLLFDADRQSAALEGEGEIVDFKDRGDIPHVKSGEVLAEKTAPTPGVPGRDVYGNTISAKLGKDIVIRCGKGAKVSENGLEVVAQVHGIPEVLADGTIQVEEELKIDGDVDFNSGHVVFVGTVSVSGTIQAGFNVKCSRLSAGEMDNAEVEIEGDIVVQGGIIGSKVKSDGDIKARFIHNSDVEALGDIIVEKSITESKLELCGTCSIKRGKIQSSKVMDHSPVN